MNAADRPVGLSVWETELYDFLVGHVRSEEVVLDRYQRLAGDAPAHVKFLLDLIVEDEARHHRLYEQWAHTVSVLVDEADGVPSLVREGQPEQLITAIDELLELEKRDARQLKDLQRTLKPVKTTTVWSLLVDMMARDTDKHIRVLEFLRAHATTTAKQP
jgi:hypothetical protein